MARIFLSIGHGGPDPGCIAFDGSHESDIALEIGLYLRNELERHGHIIGMSRTTDEIDKVASEVDECNAFEADYGVSIHCNASESHEGRGFEVFRSVNTNSKGRILAENINDAIIEAGYKSRGVKTRVNNYGKDYFYWIRKTIAPVVLCEVGFIDNEKDFAMLKTSEQRKIMAITLAKGILKTLGEEYTEELEEIIEEEIPEPTVKDIEEKRTIGDIVFDIFKLLLELFTYPSKS